MAKKQSVSFSESPELKKVYAHLNTINAKSGYNRAQIIADWLDLMFYAFQGNDPEYLAVMGKYADSNDRHSVGERPADHFAAALHSLMEHMGKTNKECLGDIYMEFLSDDASGQFFTPSQICDLMADMNQIEIPPGRTFTINDPACGAGAMLVAQAKKLTDEQGRRVLFIAQDIDWRCCIMTALNMMFFNLNSVVIWGDSLAVEARAAWETRKTICGGVLRPYDTEKAQRLISAPLQAETTVAEVPPAPPEQMSLF
jgi:type I restriction-modification system DNA methylase subunit